MNSDDIPRLSAVINPLVSKAKMKAQFPLPCWDNDGSLTGVEIQKELLMMARTRCIATASFVLRPEEIRSPEKIKQKCEIAIAAIESQVQMAIRPIRIRKVERNEAPKATV